MENNCLNCSHPIIDNFCSNCGQKKFKRIDRKYLIDEVQYLVVHTNKGFFYSVKNIIKNPGKTAKEFIDGNRVNHYKPLLLAFVLSGISSFLSFKVIGFTRVMQEYYSNQKFQAGTLNDMMSFLSSYSSAIMLLLIPLASIFTRLVFRKWGHNYYEHIVMNTFIQIFYTIFSIVILSPILYFLKDSPNTFMFFVMSSVMIYPFIMIWFYSEFYKERSIGDIIVKVLLFLAIGCAIYIAFIISIILYYILFDPEALKQFQPKK